MEDDYIELLKAASEIEQKSHPRSVGCSYLLTQYKKDRVYYLEIGYNILSSVHPLVIDALIMRDMPLRYATNESFSRLVYRYHPPHHRGPAQYPFIYANYLATPAGEALEHRKWEKMLELMESYMETNPTADQKYWQHRINSAWRARFAFQSLAKRVGKTLIEYFATANSTLRQRVETFINTQRRVAAHNPQGPLQICKIGLSALLDCKRLDYHRNLSGSSVFTLSLATAASEATYPGRFQLWQFIVMYMTSPAELTMVECLTSTISFTYPYYGGVNIEQAGMHNNSDATWSNVD